MAESIYQRRGVQATSSRADGMSQRQTGGKVLQDNRESSQQLKQLMSATSASAVQRIKEGDEPLQGQFAGQQTAQLEQPAAPKPNHTGLPDNLKTGIESLSGMSMDNVRVHYNSAKPTQLNALAYAQGTDIHVASGQERHLPHEAWHVVQQAQGRVRPTMQMKGGVPVNDDKGLEREADVMGGMAAIQRVSKLIESDPIDSKISNYSVSAVVQPKLYVIGEHHPDTDLRLEQEKEYCAEKYGAGFYLESEYKLPGTEVTADPRALMGMRDAITPLYYTPDFLGRSDDMSEEDLDDEAEHISDKIDGARLQVEELEKNPDIRFAFEDGRLKTIMPLLEELDNALTDLRLETNLVEKKKLIAKIKSAYDNLRGSIVIIHKITLSHAKRMINEIDKSRSAGMAKALIATNEDQQGVWKVGDYHIPQIREVIEEEQEQFLGQVISESAFNDVFLKWFEAKYKIKYDEYIEKRAKL